MGGTTRLTGMALALLAALAAGPAARSRAAEAPPGAVAIGAALDLSGRGAALGKEARDALLLEIDRANQAGGGIAGREIVLRVVDTAGSPEGAAEAVQELAREGEAAAIIGPVSIPEALAAAREAAKQQIPLFTLTAPEELFDPARPWVFSTAIPASLGAKAIFSHMAALGASRMALLGSGDPEGAEGRALLSALAPPAGVTILMNEAYRPNEHNFLPFFHAARVRGVEAFVHWGRAQALLAVVRARMALDLGLPIYLETALGPGLDLKEAGRAAEGVVFPAARVPAAAILPPDSPGLREIAEFREAFIRRHRRTPDGVAGFAADAFRLLVGAMRAAGPSRARIPKYLVDTRRYTGLTGRFDFSETDHNGLGADALIMVRIRQGQWTLESVPEGR
ncbi:MAG: ABC transporter substrate-binding protein [Nitrospinota bacterium]